MARSDRIITFSIISLHDHRLFLHEESKRATAALEAGELPFGSKITLRRGGRNLCAAEIVYGATVGLDLHPVFRGPRPLVAATEETDRALKSLGVLPPDNDDLIALCLRADSEDIYIGDRITIDLGPKDRMDAKRTKWLVSRWLVNCTQANVLAAVKCDINRRIRNKHP